MRQPLLLLSLLAGTAAPVVGQGTPPRLGRIDFPASGSAEAHRDFVTGVLWMHSFEYPRAAAAFQRAQQLDPDFALAYWGEALSYTHPVWNQQDLPAARVALARLGLDPAARRARAPTHREQMYLDAVEALYGEGSKPRRDTLYAEAMERLVRAHPDDLEAKAFYALALIGLSQGVRDTATYRRAAAWADTVFAANPDHPGAAHYLIHSWDDPFNAHRGLPAARAYARIAPDAAHAQHMTTHIFLALGMWEEVLAQNTVAMNLTTRLPGHYTSWLHYALLQMGRLKEAAAFLDELRENMTTQRARREPALAWMRLTQVLHTDEWHDGAALWSIDVSGYPPDAQAAEQYFRGLVAVQIGSGRGIDSAIAGLAALERAVAWPDSGAIAVQRLELEGWREANAGRWDAGIAVLRRAAALQDRLPLEFGPPVITQPSHELLGMALARDRPAEAVRAFQRSLELAPGRALSLIGLARSARVAGDLATARRAVEQLERYDERSDPEWKALLRLLTGPP